jgi:hypothetical protein
MKSKKIAASDYTTGLKRSALFSNLIQGNVPKTVPASITNTYNNLVSTRAKNGPASLNKDRCIVTTNSYEIKQDMQLSPCNPLSPFYKSL